MRPFSPGSAYLKANLTDPIIAMIDVGVNYHAYGKALSDRVNLKSWQPPSAVLAEAGLSPSDIEHVFLTHAHFDHAGNTDAFPNATFYIQERELSQWVWSQSLDRKFRWLQTAVDPSDIMRIAELAQKGGSCPWMATERTSCQASI